MTHYLKQIRWLCVLPSQVLKGTSVSNILGKCWYQYGKHDASYHGREPLVSTWCQCSVYSGRNTVGEEQRWTLSIYSSLLKRLSPKTGKRPNSWPVIWNVNVWHCLLTDSKQESCYQVYFWIWSGLTRQSLLFPSNSTREANNWKQVDATVSCIWQILSSICDAFFFFRMWLVVSVLLLLSVIVFAVWRQK